MAQTITKKHGEDIIIVDEESVEPPPTGDCNCEMKVGTVTTLQPGQPATVTMSEDAEGVYTIDYGIPQGQQGIPGTPGSGSGGSCKLGAGNVNVKDYGSNIDDGNTDAAVAFMSAWEAIKGTGGRIHVPIPNNFYNVKQPIKIWPTQGSGDPQIWCSIDCAGGEASKGFRWTGGSNSQVFDFMGNNSGRVEGLRIGIDGGRSGVACVLVRTNLQSQSIKNVEWHDCYFTLGAGPNYGFKFICSDYSSPDNGDISLMKFFNCNIYGGRYPNPPIAGSCAYLSQVANCLAMSVYSSFVETCDNVFSNWSTGPDNSRGGATWSFYDLQTSHNGCNFLLDREGYLNVFGGRFEVDQMILKTRGGNHPLNVTLLGIRADHMLNATQFDINQAITLELINCQIHKPDPMFNELVLLRGGGNASTIDITCGATRATQIIRRSGGTPNCKVYIRGLQKISAGAFLNSVEGHYPDVEAETKITPVMGTINGVQVVTGFTTSRDESKMIF